MDINLETLGQFPCCHLSGIIIAVVAILLYLVLLKPDRRIQKYLKKFDGPVCLPIIGSSYLFLRPMQDLPTLLLALYKNYNSVVKVWIGNTPYVALNRASDVEKILSSTSHVEKSTDYNFMHKWLGLGLLTAKPHLWHIRRKLLTPTFHFKILEEFTEVFNEEGNTLVDILKKERSDGKIFNIYPYITRCAMDIICETAMGIKMHAQQPTDHTMNYVNAVYGYGPMVLRKVLLPWLQISFVWTLLGYAKLEKRYLQVMHQFTENVILARKAEREQEKLASIKKKDHIIIEEQAPKRRKAFLDLLLDLAETEHSLSDMDIRDETSTFMFEGHDTTAANMGWTIFLLSLYPEYQKKIQDELDEIFGSDKNRNITSSDISRMKWLSLCVKESLRLYPSVPFFLRFLNEDADLGNNRIIPRGTNVFISSFSMHRDPEVFPDPETFYPERFLPENCVGRSPYAYIPFSAGQRGCIGARFALLEEKIILSKVLLWFNLESIVKKREDVKMLPDIILRPMGGIHVRITQRK